MGLKDILNSNSSSSNRRSSSPNRGLSDELRNRVPSPLVSSSHLKSRTSSPELDTNRTSILSQVGDGFNKLKHTASPEVGSSSQIVSSLPNWSSLPDWSSNQLVSSSLPEIESKGKRKRTDSPEIESGPAKRLRSSSPEVESKGKRKRTDSPEVESGPAKRVRQSSGELEMGNNSPIVQNQLVLANVTPEVESQVQEILDPNISNIGLKLRDLTSTRDKVWLINQKNYRPLDQYDNLNAYGYKSTVDNVNTTTLGPLYQRSPRNVFTTREEMVNAITDIRNLGNGADTESKRILWVWFASARNHYRSINWDWDNLNDGLQLMTSYIREFDVGCWFSGELPTQESTGLIPDSHDYDSAVESPREALDEDLLIDRINYGEVAEDTDEYWALFGNNFDGPNNGGTGNGGPSGGEIESGGPSGSETSNNGGNGNTGITGFNFIPWEDILGNFSIINQFYIDNGLSCMVTILFTLYRFWQDREKYGYV